MNLRFAANLSMLYGEVPFLDRFARAAAAGFDTVEFLFPYRAGIDQVKARVDDLGLTVALFDVPPGDTAEGEFGTLGTPGKQERFRRSFATALEAANRLRCGRINVLFGNREPGVEPGDQIECAVENLDWAVPQAVGGGVVLLIESLNPTDFPRYFLHTPAAAIEIVRAANHPHVKLQYDVYHAQMVGDNPIEWIARHFSDIGHIQIADAPGRHEPGTGQIDYPAIFSTLEALVYQGYIGLEYKPSHKTDASLNWLPLECRRTGDTCSPSPTSGELFE